MTFFIWKILYAIWGLIQGSFLFIVFTVVYLESKRPSRNSFSSPSENEVCVMLILLWFFLGLFIEVMPSFSPIDEEHMTECIAWSKSKSSFNWETNTFEEVESYMPFCTLSEKYETECLEYVYDVTIGIDEIGEPIEGDVCVLESEGEWKKEYASFEDIQDQILATIHWVFRITSFWISFGICLCLIYSSYESRIYHKSVT